MPNPNMIVNPGFDLYYVNTSPQEYTGIIARISSNQPVSNELFYETSPFVVYDGTTIYKVPKEYCPFYLVQVLQNESYTGFQTCCLKRFSIKKDDRYFDFHNQIHGNEYSGENRPQLWDTRYMTTIADEIPTWEQLEIPSNELTLAKNHVVKIKLMYTTNEQMRFLRFHWTHTQHVSFEPTTIQMFNEYFQNLKLFNGFCYQNSIRARLRISDHLSLPLGI